MTAVPATLPPAGTPGAAPPVLSGHPRLTRTAAPLRRTKVTFVRFNSTGVTLVRRDLLYQA